MYGVTDLGAKVFHCGEAAGCRCFGGSDVGGCLGGWCG